MNKPDPIATTRTHDHGENAARLIDPHADPNTIATWAILFNRGLVTFEEIRDAVARAQAKVLRR